MKINDNNDYEYECVDDDDDDAIWEAIHLNAK